MTLRAQRSISVVFPAYNEEANIEKTVGQAINCLEHMFQDWEVIVVNDGSQDKTGAIVDALVQQNARVTALHHHSNEGYGAALKSGIQQASKELIFFCDSDLQFHLSELVLLLSWIEQYDVVIGYRAHRRDPLHRRLNAWGWKILVRLVLGLRVRDIDCAFKLFRQAVFNTIKIDAVGAMVNTDILVQTTKMGFRIKEVPVTHFPRVHGEQTGANFRVVLKAFRELRQLHRKLRHIRPVVLAYDRRQGLQASAPEEQRVEERRTVQLPINFSDRRQRLLHAHGCTLPLTFATDMSSIVPARERPPLKIAMAVACPFPANHGTPGAIREMTQALVATGHEVHVVTYHFGEGALSKDVQMHRIRDVGFKRAMVVGPTWQKPLLDLLMVGTLCRVVRAEGIDVIHAHNYEGALVGWVASWLTRRPLVYHAVNTMSDELPTYGFIKPEGLARWLAAVLDHWVPRMADHIITISDDLTRFLHDQGIPPERMHQIPLGIDLAPFQNNDRSLIRERYHIGDKPLVMYTGILDRFQRVDYLFKAMRTVVDKQDNAQLLIVTNLAKEHDLQSCQEMIEALDLQEHVAIVTHDTFEEIPLFLAAADVAVVCRPRCPGFPVKLLNYLAAGKPIVAFEGSAKGLHHLQHAFVVPDHDWEELGRGIATLLEYPELAETLGQHGRQWAEEHFAWTHLVGQIEDVYYNVLASRP